MIPREGDTVRFSTMFLWALRNEVFMQDFQSNPFQYQASEHFPYRSPGPSFWEGRLYVDSVEKQKNNTYKVRILAEKGSSTGLSLILNQSGELLPDILSLLRSQIPFKQDK